MSGSDHTAAGQALGYSYQFDRATYRLLQAEQNVVSVGVENTDDVSVIKNDGTKIHEQDKATITTRSTLTDRSAALWKTLAVWTEQVTAAPQLVDTTEFHLVTNSSVDSATLAGRIHAATNEPEVTIVTDELLVASRSLREDLRQFGKVLIAAGPAVLRRLVPKIFILGNVPMDLRTALDQLPSLRFFSALQREAVFDRAAGWVRQQVLAAAQKGDPTTIDRAAFDLEVRALLRHVTVAPLAVLFDAPTSEMDPSRYRTYGFFQQLDWVDSDPLFARDCVIHYAQARHTRAKWAETDAVPEATLRDYEADLKFRWRLLAEQQRHRTYASPILQGHELLTQTLSEDTTIDGQQLPKAFTCGNFHALADFDERREPEIGWHPGFKNKARGGPAKP